MFADKRVLVTGASKDIGRGIALELAGRGVTVVGTYNTGAADAEELLSLGVEEMVHLDYCDREESAATLARLAAAGPFHGLVNNAAVIEFTSWESSLESWDRVFDVNLRGPLATAIALAPAMPPGSSIVNISSTAGATGSFDALAYSASKAALTNLTKSLANVLGPSGIRVNTVSPCYIDADAPAESAGLTPLRRNGFPDDIASVVAFLLTDDARFVTGTEITVDGGYTAADALAKRAYDGG
ncbi:SDR family oxidoreductase [Streptomyces sp. NRRL B-1677]|uniref:SDR family NAD(P)-dependent oxidoreductase n=1 Tax=Streptomyces sp. NRRL B-1677 TaxID=2682966 RepID=UPI001892BD60|nr:SDR family oxidoreductase [Streptomyces sp. NRRL B-1677]MBF6047053.1 SDR family oxidoreductase [Streptomyces sp. NRRL B-1677]